jgi:hypothetical protein
MADDLLESLEVLLDRRVRDASDLIKGLDLDNSGKGATETMVVTALAPMVAEWDKEGVALVVCAMASRPTPLSTVALFAVAVYYVH